MANEVQRYAFGTIASPTPAESGEYILTYDGQQTANIAYDASLATIIAALEGLSNIGVGDVDVTITSNVYSVEFKGALANTNVPELSGTAGTLKQDASTINITNNQSGIADTSVTPTNTTTTSNVSPQNEIQLISFGGATTGTFWISGPAGSGEVTSLDNTGLTAALDAAIGSGNYSLSFGGFSWNVEFTGTYANTNVATMSISTNTTDGSPYVQDFVTGTAGNPQVDTCTFSGTANAGAMSFGGNSLAYNSNASMLSIPGATTSGTPASGTITTTWQDNSSHTPIGVSADTLAIVGRPQIVAVTLPDSPTEGSLSVMLDGAGSGVFNATDNTAGTLAGWATGGSTLSWTYTRDTNAANVSISASEDTALRKSITNIQVSTLTQGGADSPDISSFGSGNGFGNLSHGNGFN